MFLFPLIEPDRRFSRVRLSEKRLRFSPTEYRWPPWVSTTSRTQGNKTASTFTTGAKRCASGATTSYAGGSPDRSRCLHRLAAEHV